MLFAELAEVCPTKPTALFNLSQKTYSTGPQNYNTHSMHNAYTHSTSTVAPSATAHVTASATLTPYAYNDPQHQHIMQHFLLQLHTVHSTPKGPMHP